MLQTVSSYLRKRCFSGIKEQENPAPLFIINTVVPNASNKSISVEQQKNRRHKDSFIYDVKMSRARNGTLILPLISSLGLLKHSTSVYI